MRTIPVRRSIEPRLETLPYERVEELVKAQEKFAVASPFIARHEPETCENCGLCLDRCQMDALTLEDDQVALNSDRCIG